MDKSPFPNPTSREPNPLRPYSAYYREPSIGVHPSASIPQSSHTPRTAPRAPSASLSSTARDLLPELDLDLKTSAGEAWQNTRSLFDTLLYRYTSVLLAQPFDVAKTLLQVSLPPGQTEVTPPRIRTDPRRRDERGGSTTRSRKHQGRYEPESDVTEEAEGSEDDDDEIPDYFTATAPRSRSPRKRRRTPPSEAELSPTPTPCNRHQTPDPQSAYQLNLKKANSLTHVLSTVYNTSGAVGCWRGTNTTFLYTCLLRTTDTFLRSLLLAVLGLPDITGPEQSGLAPALGVAGGLGLSGLDLSDSPNVMGSLIVVGLSSCLTGLLLTPLDLVRTRLIITPTSHAPRGLVQNLRRLPSLFAPSILWLPTALSHTLPALFSASTPLLLRRQLKISPERTPSLWSMAAFATCIVDLFLRLPLETVVRRAQISSLKAADHALPTIVETGAYTGVTGTLYNIVYSEGEMRTKDPRTGMIKLKRGQGLSGLVRGWRVGFWGLVGVWGAGALGGGDGRGRGEF
ncbi:hypothetical protein LTR62_008444 [Meristemomyces frigidus]|uniref:Uncharacterized protein n=1 Tax=Meristemomyces frigidus TaxID=1508187 RepID=A0AAN7YSX3_9PEZI|nr:hypothetical protein LTR62_008444 [Meristemomyces frigidus]